MRDIRRRDLEARLQELDRNQKRMLYRRAQKLRRAAGRSKESDEGWDGSDDAPSVERNARRRRDSIHDWALRLMEQEAARCEASESDAPAARMGIVVSARSGACDVESEGEIVEARFEIDLPVAPGDEVGLAPRPGTWAVVELKPRRTRLSRPQVFLGHREQVIAANIDAAVIVASAREPDLRPRLVDRYLIAIQYGGAVPVVCVNKADLVPQVERAELEEALQPWRDAGVPVVLASASTGEGIPALRSLLSGSLAVFVGQSGVGKSSLVNALDPSLDIRTGAVREYDGKGRHTTTGSELHTLADGLRVIDSPGVRGFGLWDISRRELPHYFPEFAAAKCRFSDCSHDHEPGCAIREAVKAGTIPAARFESYLRILASLASPSRHEKGYREYS